MEIKDVIAILKEYDILIDSLRDQLAVAEEDKGRALIRMDNAFDRIKELEREKRELVLEIEELENEDVGRALTAALKQEVAFLEDRLKQSEFQVKVLQNDNESLIAKMHFISGFVKQHVGEESNDE